MQQLQYLRLCINYFNPWSSPNLKAFTIVSQQMIQLRVEVNCFTIPQAECAKFYTMAEVYCTEQLVNTESSFMYSLLSCSIPFVALLRRSSASFFISLAFWLMLFRSPDTPSRESTFICRSWYLFSVSLRLWETMQYCWLWFHMMQSTIFSYFYTFWDKNMTYCFKREAQTQPTCSSEDARCVALLASALASFAICLFCSVLFLRASTSAERLFKRIMASICLSSSCVSLSST